MTVCAVCPSWVDTDLLLRDVRQGRALSVFSLYAKHLHVSAKAVPQRIVMAAWLRMLKRYERSDR